MNKEKCPYCELEKGNVKNVIFKEQSNTKRHLQVVIEDRKLKLTSFLFKETCKQLEDYDVDSSINIKYCPNCGNAL